MVIGGSKRGGETYEYFYFEFKSFSIIAIWNINSRFS